jgi:hypothetical protein
LQEIELKGGAGHVTNYVQLYPTSWDAKQAFQDGKRWADDKNRQLRSLLTANAAQRREMARPGPANDPLSYVKAGVVR